MGSSGVSWCRVRGPLAPWAAVFERWLAARGYARWTVRKRVCQLARLSCWLEREGLAVWELNEQSAELFVASRRQAGYVTWVTSDAWSCRWRICARSGRRRRRRRWL